MLFLKHKNHQTKIKNDDERANSQTSNVMEKPKSEQKKNVNMIDEQYRTESPYQTCVAHLKQYFQNYHLDHRFYSRW